MFGPSHHGNPFKFDANHHDNDLRQRILGSVMRDDCERLEQILTESNMYGLDDLALALRMASEQGHAECVRSLLAHNAMPDAHDSNGFTPLILAAKGGHPDALKILLHKKCNVNKATFRIRATSLHWACTNGFTECARLLLENGARTEAKTVHLRTPLMSAARSGFDEVVTLLLDFGAEVNAEDVHQTTALHQAAEEGNEDCVRILLKSGASLNGQTKQGDTAVLLAAKRGQDEVMKMLIQEGALVSVFGHKLSLLHWAAEGGHTDCVKMALENGLDPNIVTHENYIGTSVVNAGTTPLMIACKNGQLEVAQVLLQAGAKNDLLDIEGDSALLHAARKGFCDCVRLLIVHGADPDGVRLPTQELSFFEVTETEDHGVAPIFVAIQKEHYNVLKVLLQANCNTDIIGLTDGGEITTPFEMALRKGSLRMARMLLLAGVRPSVTNIHNVLLMFSSVLDEDPDALTSIIQEIISPHSLLQLSRNAIRANLGRRALTRLQELPLPPPLIQYVALADFYDV